MVGNYLTDRIDIITETKDEWGVITETTQSDIQSRYEDINKIIRNNKGEEVTSNGMLVVARTATLTYYDKIKLKKVVGIDHELATKKMAIQKLTKAHGFKNSHWEVWI